MLDGPLITAFSPPLALTGRRRAGLEISWMGKGGQVAAFEGKFLCFAHSLAFMATFPIGALPQLLKGGKKLLSVQKYPNRSPIYPIGRWIS